MPYARQTLSEIRAEAIADIQAALPGADPFLRFAVLRILAVMLAGMSNEHYGYIDWVAKMAVPFTAEGEFLYAWGALKDVYLKAASIAGDRSIGGAGSVQFIGCTPGSPIPDGSPMVRGDGQEYFTLGDAIVSGGGTVTVDVEALNPGAAGNCPINTQLVLASSLAGINTNTLVTVALTGGADVETEEEFRSRMLAVYRNPPMGGAKSDYEIWSLQVAGVTRAWCEPLWAGAGTVGVFFMMDDVRAAFGGFPQGTNGVAAGETRDAPATGDQLLVADYIFGPTRQPVTALVYVMSPTDSPVAFTIDAVATVAIQNAIKLAIADVFLANSAPGGTVNILDIQAAVDAVPGTEGVVITSPAVNIVAAAGHLSTLGAVTWT